MSSPVPQTEPGASAADGAIASAADGARATTHREPEPPQKVRRIILETPAETAAREHALAEAFRVIMRATIAAAQPQMTQDQDSDDEDEDDPQQEQVN